MEGNQDITPGADTGELNKGALPDQAGGGQAGGAAGGGQPGASTDFLESSGIDVNSLPPELKAVHKNMQGHFTRKTQTVAQREREIAEYEAKLQGDADYYKQFRRMLNDRHIRTRIEAIEAGKAQYEEYVEAVKEAAAEAAGGGEKPLTRKEVEAILAETTAKQEREAAALMDLNDFASSVGVDKFKAQEKRMKHALAGMYNDPAFAKFTAKQRIEYAWKEVLGLGLPAANQGEPPKPAERSQRPGASGGGGSTPRGLKGKALMRAVASRLAEE